VLLLIVMMLLLMLMLMMLILMMLILIMLILMKLWPLDLRPSLPPLRMRMRMRMRVVFLAVFADVLLLFVVPPFSPLISTTHSLLLMRRRPHF